MDDYKYLFKIVLVGNAGVGKTCLVRQFTQGIAPNGHQGATIGVDFMIKTVVVNGTKVKLQLWDTAGQERFRSITQSYYRSAHCLILVYDISSQASFDALTKWIRDVDAVLDRETQLGIDVLRVLVGNKSDKEREVPYSIGEKFLQINKLDLFVETSALELDSVDKLFNDVANMLVAKRRDDPTNDSKPSMNLDQPSRESQPRDNQLFGPKTCSQC